MKKTVFITFLIFCLVKTVVAQQAAETIKGAWLTDMEHNDVGQVNTVMYFESTGNTFEANTRRNADRDLLGWWASTLGRTFTKSFKKGSLLRIVNGTSKTENDTLKLTGILVSALGNLHFRAYVREGTMHARLTNRKGEVRGLIRAKKETPKLPLEDYSLLFKSAAHLTEERIFKRNVLETKQWKKFSRKMEKVSARVKDDLEMVFAFFYYSRKLPFSHYALMKIPDQERGGVSRERFVSIEEKFDGIGYMKIVSLGGTASEMDSAFMLINSKNYKNLIVDLRDNSGGSIEAGMAFATSVFDSSFYGGVFLTQKWFNSHSAPPAVDSYSNFPHFSQANFDLIIDGIHNTEALCLKINPKKEVYKGKLYILTNKKTASTCEPLVYGLKQLKRATIVGEKTAGAMLNGETFPLYEGYKLVVPTADYYASDGYHIDQQGVKPDLETSPGEALEFVLKQLNK